MITRSATPSSGGPTIPVAVRTFFSAWQLPQPYWMNIASPRLGSPPVVDRRMHPHPVALFGIFVDDADQRDDEEQAGEDPEEGLSGQEAHGAPPPP